MKLYAIVIETHSGFGTPLKGDTLFGQFCWEVAMDPRTRTLFKVVIENELATDRTISELMGRDVEPRFRLVMEETVGAEELDI